ncbi:glycosyltransferase family 39 protein [Candidatus Gottesmanbacteria bacterium]|nr:glycosyltransferase family 39 protein [Candidatus Gottesmanbacteria bacterium]
MKESPEDRTSTFWTSVAIAFALLVHNGREPVFLAAMAMLPLVILLFLRNKKLLPFAIYIIIFGALGRYTRYFRETYASDTLLAIKDHIGYFLAGKNVYDQVVMAQAGPTPFTYLPFSLFWYLPARLLTVDLRFFEMLVSTLVAPLVFVYGRIHRTWKHLPVVAVVAITPFLLDLSADGSNDNSAIFLLLAAVTTLTWAMARKNTRGAVVSAVVLGLAASFKHYLAFFLLFFLPYVLFAKEKFPITKKAYVLFFLGTVAIVSLPFILASPAGFFRSLFFIEIGNFHTVWGWNIWVALRDGLGIVASRREMWMVRTVATGIVALGLLKFFKLHNVQRVLIASGITMLVYLMTSDWTTYAYFTFLVPLIGLGAVAGGGEKI